MNTYSQFSVATSLLYYRYASYRLMHTTLNDLHFPGSMPGRKLLPGVKPREIKQTRQEH